MHEHGVFPIGIMHYFLLRSWICFDLKWWIGGLWFDRWLLWLKGQVDDLYFRFFLSQVPRHCILQLAWSFSNWLLISLLSRTLNRISRCLCWFVLKFPCTVYWSLVWLRLLKLFISFHFEWRLTCFLPSWILLVYRSGWYRNLVFTAWILVYSHLLPVNLFLLDQRLYLGFFLH
jgi:hypothetical protein